jgi:hypothetical protein
MSLSIELLPESIKHLENHPESLRIKKFVYCLCKHIWENDPTVFNQHSLENLLTQLIENYPTLKKLSLAMYTVVKSLNRQQTYIIIAKEILDQLAPIYHANQNELENSQVHKLEKEELAKKNAVLPACVNLMESFVKEHIFQELKKLPLNLSQALNPEEIAAHALNRLPSLYISSEEGKVYQAQKIEQMQDKIYLVVTHSIGAIMRDPIRKSTPIQNSSIDSFAEVNSILRSLKDFVKDRSDINEKSKFDDLSTEILNIVNEYDNALIELERFFKIQNLSEEKITAKNLARMVKKIIRQLTKAIDRQPQLSDNSSKDQENSRRMETEFYDFFDDDHASETSIKSSQASIRDWYSY